MTQSSLPRSVRLGRPLFAGLATLFATGTAVLVLTASTAAAQPQPRLVTGNVTTCTEAGLSGTKLFGDEDAPPPPQPSGTGSVVQPNLTVTINAGFTASGIVVKGGPNTNVYDGPFVGPITLTNLTAPINPANNKPFDISHWFVCGGPSTSPSPSVSVTPTSSVPVPSGAARTGGGGSTGGLALFGTLSLLAVCLPVAVALYLRRRNEPRQN